MAVRKYRVREGFHYGASDQYGPGDIVELEESTAQYEMDKLELAEIVHNVPNDTTEEVVVLQEENEDSTEEEETSPTKTPHRITRRKSAGD